MPIVLEVSPELMISSETLRHRTSTVRELYRKKNCTLTPSDVGEGLADRDPVEEIQLVEDLAGASILTSCTDSACASSITPTRWA
jgi:hypothetical protein